ncbi:MAG TPA: hypothetical protein VJA19_13260 [Pseudomonas sp.]|nr:hypothetical protein [Pseudomonas sp.]
MIEPIPAYGGLAPDPANNPGVSWRAIIAGAVGAAALSLILILLGAGFGFGALSPWSDRGASAETLGLSAILWLTLTQIAASGLGGYLAGRLRVRWADLQDDEVYFRDTAHGFLAWSLATLLSASLAIGLAGSLLGNGLQAGVKLVDTTSTAVSGLAKVVSLEYHVDLLFRTEQALPTSAGDLRAEVMRIFGTGIAQGQLGPEDRQYLGRMVAQHTGLAQPEAERRVEETFTRAVQALQQVEIQAKAVAEGANKVAAWSSLWMFVALLCGAFVASLAATLGGKQRDRLVYTRSLA